MIHSLFKYLKIDICQILSSKCGCKSNVFNPSIIRLVTKFSNNQTNT